jgi:hypothetical protein
MQWSRNRCQGLVDVYQAAGLDNGVRSYTLTEYFQLPRSRSERKPDAQKGGAGSGDGMVTVAFDHLRRWAGTSYYHALFNYGVERRHVDPLMERLIGDGAVSAVVCMNDNIAIYALDYCTERGIRVPDDLAIAGFDNSPDSLYANLTTYSYDLLSLTELILRHLTGRKTPGARSGRVLEVEGMVIERASTRR